MQGSSRIITTAAPIIMYMVCRVIHIMHDATQHNTTQHNTTQHNTPSSLITLNTVSRLIAVAERDREKEKLNREVEREREREREKEILWSAITWGLRTSLIPSTIMTTSSLSSSSCSIPKLILSGPPKRYSSLSK
jgi:cell division FtsZ-interacting protein ZapD